MIWNAALWQLAGVLEEEDFKIKPDIEHTPSILKIIRSYSIYVLDVKLSLGATITFITS